MCQTRISSLLGRFTVLVITCYFSLSAQGKTIHVKVGGTGDGSSWGNAYGSLQAALDDAEPNDSIWVAEGTYKPTKLVDPCDPRSATFQMKNGVGIYGGFPGVGDPNWEDRDWEEYEMVLSGDFLGNDVEVGDPCDLLDEPTRAENSYHVVTGSGTDSNAILDGFTIKNGNANGLDPNFSDSHGGGMYNDVNSSPMLINCKFVENSALLGGGMYNLADEYADSKPKLMNCIFIGNSAENYGGGMYNEGENHDVMPMLMSCTFASNVAKGEGGGIFVTEGILSLENCQFSNNSGGYGGAILIDDSHAHIADCVFSGNLASEDGGGVNSYDSDPILINCTFSGNSAEGAGGGLSNEDQGDPTLTNCTFSQNSAGGDGGGMFNDSNSTAILTDCNFSENVAGHDGGGVHYNQGGETTIDGCIFRRNLCVSGTGGAVSAEIRVTATLTNCVFEDNSAPQGGGVECEYCNLRLMDCHFIGNTVSEAGGAVYFEADDEDDVGLGAPETPVLARCVFVDNYAGQRGGAISNEFNSSMVDCLFQGNRAVSLGGAMWTREADLGPIVVMLDNCTFNGNIAGDEGGAVYGDSGSTLQTANSILYGDIPNELVAHEEVVVTYSNVEGGWPGFGNIDVDPCFVDVNNGDYHLKSQGGRYDPNTQAWVMDDVTSPCIDAGNPMSPIGSEPFPNGGAVNMGAYGGTTEASKSYFDIPPCETIVAGDVNGDCIVNFLDFRLMALHWCEDNNP